MENLHLKNLDIDKLLNKPKTQNLPEQIKQHIPIDDNNDNEVDGDRLKNLICNTVFGGLIFAHVVLAIMYPDRLIAFGYSLFGL